MEQIRTAMQNAYHFCCNNFEQKGGEEDYGLTFSMCITLLQEVQAKVALNAALEMNLNVSNATYVSACISHKNKRFDIIVKHIDEPRLIAAQFVAFIFVVELFKMESCDE